MILKIMRHYLQDKQFINLYSSFIKPYIEYGTLAWGGACKTNLTEASTNQLEQCFLKTEENPQNHFTNISIYFIPLEYKTFTW